MGRLTDPKENVVLSPEHADALARGVMDAMPGGVIHVRADGSIAAANAEALRALGWSYHELSQRYTRSCDTETLREDGSHFPVEEFPVNRALATGEAQPGVVMGVRKPDGQIVWAVFRALPIKEPGNDQVVGAFVTFVDITERKRAEESLQAHRDLLRKAQELANVGTWEWDILTGEIRWTDQMHAIHGIPPGTFSGSFEEALGYIHPDDREAIQARVEALLEVPPAQFTMHPPMEFRILRSDGEERLISGTGEAVFDEGGRATKFIGALQDVTAHRRLEMQLRQSQRLESIGQLAGGIAHDFNNLLQPILGNAELILRGADVLPAVAEIKLAAERASELTRQLLVFGRRQLGQPIPLDVNWLIGQLVPLLQRMLGERVHVAFDPGERLGSVVADRSQLEQVLLNLSINARDAMPDGGQLTIRTRACWPDATFRRTHPWAEHEQYVAIAVSDTGTGMTATLRNRVFEPFFTTKEAGAGTGLGLAVVHGIVHTHGGAIEVDSTPGAGSTFRAYLPASGMLPVSPSIPVPQLASRGGTETILVVEDDTMVRRTTVRILRSAGYQVLEAADAESALTCFHANAHEIALVLSDVVMPGFSGPELARQLRETFPQVRVLFTTGYAAESSRELQSEQVLPKPYGTEQLLHAVRLALRSSDAPLA